MKIAFEKKPMKSDTLIVFAADGAKLSEAAKALDRKTGGSLSRAVKAEGFKGKSGETLVVAGPTGIPQKYLVLLGAGTPDALQPRDLEKIGSQLVALLNNKKSTAAALMLDVFKKGTDQAAGSIALGGLLNSYRFDKYLTTQPKDKKPTLKTLQLIVDNPPAARKVFADKQKIVDGVFLTRDLVSEVPNVLYPESFATIIKRELSGLRVKVTVLDDKQIRKLGMGALEAVGKGSDRKHRLVTMEYRGGKTSQKPVAFVGKGVTFDTGGISLKPGPGMEDMKWDMAGAGAVTGLMKVLAARRAKVNAIGIVALAENMPSGGACRPGDIVKTMSGQTVEILNTDAEGRLILCDALWYAQQKFKPTHIVDLATLTGAVIIALGHEYGGLFANDDSLAKHLVQAGDAVGEALWQMPLNDAWDKAIDSPAADIKNIASSRDAGSAIGAHFLKRFIQPGVKWAHLDIAGVAWSNKDRVGVPKGASAFGVRLLDRFVADHWE